MRRALVLSAFTADRCGCDNGVSRTRCAICIEASATEESRTRLLLHHGSARSRLRAVRPAPVPSDGRAVLLRRRSRPVRVRGAAVLVLRRASRRGRGRALRHADVLLPARAALPLVRAAAADAVRAQGRRVLVRRQLRSGLLQRATALRRDQRRLRAGRLHAAGRRRARSRRPRSTARSSRAVRASRAHAVVGAPVVSAGVYVAPPPPPVVQVGIGVGVGGGASWSARRRSTSATTTDATTAGTSTGAAARRRRRTAGGAPPPPHRARRPRLARRPARPARPPPRAWRRVAWRRPARAGPRPAARPAAAAPAPRGRSSARARRRRAGGAEARSPWTMSRCGEFAARAGRGRGRVVAVAGCGKKEGAASARAVRPPRRRRRAAAAARRRHAPRRRGDQGVAGRGPEPRGLRGRSRRCRSAPCTASRGACRRSTRWCANTAIRTRSIAARRELLEQWGREGVNTGVAFQTKLTLLGVLDRGRRDPNGKVVSQVVDAFRKL